VRYEEGGAGPDFRVYEDGRCVAAVEVLSLFERADWEQERRRHGRLADELNRRVRPTAGYFVHLEIEQCDRDPAPRRFADFVCKCIAELPDPQAITLPERPRMADLPSAAYFQDGCRISIRFIPMREGATARNDPDARIVGTGPMLGGIVNCGSRLRDRLVSKAGGRYEVAGCPFMIAACIHDFLCADDEVLAALYGGEAVAVDTGQLVRRRNGFFGMDAARRTGRNTRVSAVGVVSGLKTWVPEEADIAVLENPHAVVPWPRDVLPARRWYGPVHRGVASTRFGWR
jgi:hypothetical protein